MSQQTYPFACEYCGTVHHAASEDAGTKRMCQCFNLVTVPELHELWAVVPEGETAPDVALAEAARLGRLPFETRCATCGQPTTGVAVVTVHSRGSKARAAVESAATLGVVALYRGLGLPFGGLASKALTDNDGTDHRTFALPVRVCAGCRPKLFELTVAAAAIKKTPLYVRLLADSQTVRLAEVDGTPTPQPATPDPTTKRRARRVALGWVIASRPPRSRASACWWGWCRSQEPRTGSGGTPPG